MIFLYWLIVPLMHAVIVDLILAVLSALRGQFGFGASLLLAMMFSFLTIPASLVFGVISYLMIRDGAAPRWVLSVGSLVYAIALNLLLFHSRPNGMPDSLESLVLPSWLATMLGLFWAGWRLGGSDIVARPRRGD